MSLEPPIARANQDTLLLMPRLSRCYCPARYNLHWLEGSHDGPGTKSARRQLEIRSENGAILGGTRGRGATSSKPGSGRTVRTFLCRDAAGSCTAMLFLSAPPRPTPWAVRNSLGLTKGAFWLCTRQKKTLSCAPAVHLRQVPSLVACHSGRRNTRTDTANWRLSDEHKGVISSLDLVLRI